MKKVSILVKSSWADTVLKTLGQVGIVHLSAEKLTQNETINTVKNKIQLIHKALALIPEAFHKKEISKSDSLEDGFVVAKQLLAIVEGIKDLEEEVEILKMEHERLQIWGRFDPQEVRKLKDKGINIMLFECHQKELETIPDEYGILILSMKGTTRYGVLLSMHRDKNIPLKEIHLPSRGLVEVEKLLKVKSEELLHRKREENRLFTLFPILKETLNHFLKILEYQEAMAGMTRQGDIAYIVGFCPIYEISVLKKKAIENHWAILIEEPLENDPVPTLIQYSTWTKLFRPVMNFIGVIPGYREYDTNGIFLIFFSLFFALLIGDAGYGLILLLFSYGLEKYFRNVQKETIFLFYLLSTATIIWGAVTGTWFSAKAFSELPILRAFVIPKLYTFAEESDVAVMHLCFLIGCVHLCFAHMQTAIRKYPALSAMAEVGWIAIIWSIYFMVRFLIMTKPLHPAAFYLFGMGVITIILFTEQQKGQRVMKSLMKGAIRLPLYIFNSIGNLSDIVSYIRLFAVGLATKEVASACNKMATDIGIGSTLSIILAFFILLFGHTINLLLGAMAVLVHGVRLNLLEFSKHLNVQWSGTPYKPFTMKKEEEEIE